MIKSELTDLSESKMWELGSGGKVSEFQNSQAVLKQLEEQEQEKKKKNLIKKNKQTGGSGWGCELLCRNLPLDGTIWGNFRKYCIMRFKLSNDKNGFQEAGYDQNSPVLFCFFFFSYCAISNAGKATERKQ